MSELTDISEAFDKHYNAIVLAIKSDANFKRLPSHPPARKLHCLCDPLSLAKLVETDVVMLDRKGILVPKGACQKIIKELH